MEKHHDVYLLFMLKYRWQVRRFGAGASSRYLALEPNCEAIQPRKA